MRKNSGVEALLMGLTVHTREESEPSVDLMSYDTIILDVDSTILVCYGTDGNTIPAFQTIPPYSPDPTSINRLYDDQGQMIELEKGFLDKVNMLSEAGKRLFIVSKSENEHLDNGDIQPVEAILKAFGIFHLFEDVFVDADAKKSDYVKEIEEGDTAFVDDQQKNLEDVAVNTDVDSIDPDSTDLFAKYYTRLVTANLNYDETLKNLNQDRENAGKGIYTERNEDGSIRFKVDLNRGTVGDYVDSAYRLQYPGVHEFRPLSEEEVSRFQRLNEQNLSGFEDRIKALDKHADPSDVIGSPVIHELEGNPDQVSQVMDRIGLVQNGKVDMDVAEKLHVYNGGNSTSKFFAGVAYELMDLEHGSTYYKKMLSDVAYQIACHEVYGAYDGESRYRATYGMDSIPASRSDVVTPQTLFRSARGREQDVDPAIWNIVREKSRVMNYWGNQGIYEFDDPASRTFSNSFKSAFPEYVQRHDQIKSRTQEIISRIKSTASKLMLSAPEGV